MRGSNQNINHLSYRDFLTFIAISLFYLFETAQMSYYNVLAPAYLNHDIYTENSVAAISAAYYYGDMVGLFPVGYALDRFSLRSCLIFALIGTIIGSFILFISDSFTMQWISRFICGFCGGTFSFVGGIRLISIMFHQRFTYFMAVFLTAGILGALLCQYPLLLLVNHFGPKSAMFVMFSIGFAIAIFNWFYLHPPTHSDHVQQHKKYEGTAWKMFKEIVFNSRNFSDVLMVVLLETPTTIISTLWGVVLLMNFFHFSSVLSSVIVTAMLLGSLIGLPLIGHIADQCGNPPWLITLGSGMCFLILLILLFICDSHNPWLVASLFSAIGFFSSCQTIGFSWITKNMKPELIGRNSAFNSVIFMATNGGFKQIGAILLGLPPFLSNTVDSSGNLILLIIVSMLMVLFYISVMRRFIFK